jgi:hypothetical protein
VSSETVQVLVYAVPTCRRAEAEVHSLWLRLLNLSRFSNPLAEADKIAERIDHTCLKRAPLCLLKTGPHITVTLPAYLSMKFFDALHHYPNLGSGAAVPVMLA